MVKYTDVEEISLAYFKVLFQGLQGGTEESHYKIRINGLRAGIQTVDLPNSKRGPKRTPRGTVK
jgi:hypothetical protein